MDIYVIANPLLSHTVKCLRIGSRLVWHWTQVLCKGMRRTRGPGTTRWLPHHLSDSREKTWRGFPLLLGQNFVLVPSSPLQKPLTLCSGQPLLGAGGSERGPALPRVSVCLLPDLFHFRICFQLLCNYRFKKKNPQMLQKDIRHPTLWNLQLIIVNQVVST